MNIRLVWHAESDSYMLMEASSKIYQRVLEDGCDDVSDFWDEHVEPWMRKLVAGKQAKVTFGEGRDHAILSASGSKKWLVCTPSALLEESIEDEQTEYSAEGSFAHALAAWRLAHWLNRINHEQFMFGLECMKKHRFWSTDLFDHVQTFVEYVKQRINEAMAKDPSAVVILEQRLDFSQWVSEGFGTGDVVIITQGRVIVIDLKFGQGVPISPINNSQLRLYGGGAWNMLHVLFDIEDVEMVIHQPRLDSEPKGETIKATELIKWLDETVVEPAKIAWKGEGEFVPGPHCKEAFCRARFTCRARAEYMTNIVKTDPRLLTREEIGAIVLRLEGLLGYKKDVDEFVETEMIKKHGVIPGLKVVEGRSDRYINDLPAVIAAAVEKGIDRNKLYKEPKPPEPISMTDMKKLMGTSTFKVVVEPYTTKPPGKPTIVSADDPRPAWSSAKTAFEGIEDDDLDVLQ